MTRQAKIDFLILRLADRFTKEYLETKSDTFINNLFLIQEREDERKKDELIFTIY